MRTHRRLRGSAARLGSARLGALDALQYKCEPMRYSQHPDLVASQDGTPPSSRRSRAQDVWVPPEHRPKTRLFVPCPGSRHLRSTREGTRANDDDGEVQGAGNASTRAPACGHGEGVRGVKETLTSLREHDVVFPPMRKTAFPVRGAGWVCHIAPRTNPADCLSPLPQRSDHGGGIKRMQQTCWPWQTRVI